MVVNIRYQVLYLLFCLPQLPLLKSLNNKYGCQYQVSGLVPLILTPPLLQLINMVSNVITGIRSCTSYFNTPPSPEVIQFIDMVANV